MMKKKGFMLTLAWALIALLSAGFYLLRPNKTAVDWVIEHISAPLRESLGFVTNIFPFSFAEVLYTVVILYGLYLIAAMIFHIIKAKGWKNKIKLFVVRMLAVLLIPASILSGYNWLWSVGYYGTSFAEKSDMVVEGVAVEDLYAVTLHFAQKASELAVVMERDEEGHFVERDFWQDTEGLYDAMEEEFPFLKQRELTPKKMTYSKLMSLLGFSGFYFPFTGEANVNVDFPPALQPETICHELSHQRRVASESEANFVGIAAAISSGKEVYMYSGYLSGLTHLTNAVYKVDRDVWQLIIDGLPREILIDWQDNSDYWAQFESPVESVATAVYDNYLKHNDQELGIKSDWACVDLLVTYYKGKI